MASDAELRHIYATTSTIVTVGASSDSSKPASVVPRYMMYVGYRVVPVHPTASELYGLPVYASLDDVDEPLEVVDIFRPAAEAEAIAMQAIELGAKVVWLQDGAATPAVDVAAAIAGVTVVDGCCIATTYSRLGLGPEPKAVLDVLEAFA